MKNNFNNFRVLLVCYVSADVGMGHLSRLIALAETLRKKYNITAEFLIFGDLIKKKKLARFNVHNFLFTDIFTQAVESVLQTNDFKALILDLYSEHKINNLDNFFTKLKKKDICLIAIDSLIDYCNILDILWIPSFNFDCSKHANCAATLKSGWDSFLIQKQFDHKDWMSGFKVLILTGGSDISNLSRTLPMELDKLLDRRTEIHWVKGPFSSEPNLLKKPRLNWVIHNAPDKLDELIVQSNYVMTVFGVSFFEVLQYGIPTVVFSPYSNKDDRELEALAKEEVAMVAKNSESAVMGLIELMNNNTLAKNYSINALNKMSINGTESLSKKIYSLIKKD
ncbi:hypothetical protein [Candidatus Pelagibacter sp. Uisw_090]|uniref:hypothetical protein n=1 Tax=Candidatus Pelagibacter sp. Uisw_090 TaxID=3230993 RepID=UPI0039EB5D01